MKSENWLSIIQYAKKNGLSSSTVRRYIKSNKLTTKKENGKFYIKSDLASSKEELSFENYASNLLQENLALKNKIKFLENEIQKLKKQNLQEESVL